ncbi:MAG: amidophosphoribosyltransferase [Rhodospirillaceae bacterium]|nr:amidophosphoribosyltransferase [Rhodospirillaceae bacterium]
MCGIVGLFLKNRSLEPQLGGWLRDMLIGMTDRGPDSSGLAIYSSSAGEGRVKFTLSHHDRGYPWQALAIDLADALGATATIMSRANHAVVVTDGPEPEVDLWLRRNHPEVRIVAIGQRMEIFKDIGLPIEVSDRFGIAGMSGSHGIGHTRMATESAVTTEHAHPFNAGDDICLVHNGSLSNHNELRRWLRRRGMNFETDNDSEVAARYFAYRMSEGATLGEALEAGLSDLDGFYTFTVGTRDGFAVIRDGIAAKPAVLAETDDWVAMASEYRSLAHLPGVDGAVVWEPKPERVYTWHLENAA